ncbi:f-box domain-containing protein [Phthorimaea operculella]|nr:f-box domain-containing protein [Phthorimaea operculella]
MNENDFLLLKESGGSISIVDCITLLHNNKNAINEAIFILKGFETMPIKLLQAPIGDVVIVNAVIPNGNQRTFSMCFPINRYIVTSKLRLPELFTNLNTVCILFKENIIVPVKNSIQNYNGLPSLSLAGIPSEIIRKILLMLPVEDVLKLSESCKRINEIVNEDCLWFHLYDRDFADEHKREAALGKDFYRDIYREKYLKMKKGMRTQTYKAKTQTKVEMSGYLMYSCVPDPRWEVIL